MYSAQLPGVHTAAIAERQQRRQQRARCLRGVRQRCRRRCCPGSAARRVAAELGGRAAPRIREARQGGPQRMDSRT